jgi:YidC/Oxa1 family membrane protein insertase
MTMSDPQQRWIMRAMPFIFVFILINFPAGLFLYWITTNLWTIGQQLIIRRLAPPAPAVGKEPKKSRFMEALMSAQDQRSRQGGELAETKGAGNEGSGTGRGASKASGRSSGARTGAAGKPGGKGGGARTGQKGRPGQGKTAPGGRSQGGARKRKSGGSKPGGG